MPGIFAKCKKPVCAFDRHNKACCCEQLSEAMQINWCAYYFMCINYQESLLIPWCSMCLTKSQELSFRNLCWHLIAWTLLMCTWCQLCNEEDMEGVEKQMGKKRTNEKVREKRWRRRQQKLLWLIGCIFKKGYHGCSIIPTSHCFPLLTFLHSSSLSFFLLIIS